jgi:4-amino-4-deoxy-L-arabinose transferase-like glycosyltransferase
MPARDVKAIVPPATPSKMKSPNSETHEELKPSFVRLRLPSFVSDEKSPKLIFLSVIALAIYSVVRNLIHAAKPLWFDELLTQAVSRQPSASAIWIALRNGVDANPPLFYFIERFFSTAISNEMIAFRLVSVLAFSATLLCLYFFVQKRSGARAALICAACIFVTPLNTVYAAEARPYSLLVASLAFALLAYQRLPSAAWTIALLLSLSLAESLHYYAGLACFPFFVAELVCLYTTARFRTWVWLSMFASLTPAVLSIPLFLSLKRIYGAHYWARTGFDLIPKTYGVFFRLDAMWGLALASVAFLAVIGAWARSAASRETPEGNDSHSSSEFALVLGFIALPIFGVIATRIAHGGATDRYFLPAILGMLAAFGYALRRARPSQFAMIAALIFVAVGSQELGFLRSTLPGLRGTQSRATFLVPLLEAAHRDDLPLVISDAGQYVELSHDAPPSLNLRLAALVDPSSAVIYEQTDTVDKLVIQLSRCSPLQVYDFKPFAAAHPVFLLYSDGSPFDWWPSRLIHDGARLELVAKQGGGALYRVVLKPAAPPGQAPSGNLPVS